MNRTLCDKARCFLKDAGLDSEYWDEAILSATYLTNRTVTDLLDGKTPFQIWHGRIPDLSHLRVFGSKALSRRETTN